MEGVANPQGQTTRGHETVIAQATRGTGTREGGLELTRRFLARFRARPAPLTRSARRSPSVENSVRCHVHAPVGTAFVGVLHALWILKHARVMDRESHCS